MFMQNEKKKTKTHRYHAGILKIISSESFPCGFQSNFLQGNQWRYYTVGLAPLGGAAFIGFLSQSPGFSICEIMAKSNTLTIAS